MLIGRYVPCDHCDGEGHRYAANDSVFWPHASFDEDRD